MAHDGDVGEIIEMVHYCQINLTEKNIIAASRPQPLYKVGAKATLMYKTWKLCCHCSTAAKGLPKKFYFW